MNDDRRPIDDARARELLARERERIEGALKESERLRAEEHDGLDQHPSDDAERLHSEELDRGLDDKLREQLEAVERAEARLAEGTYGLSVESGEPIPAGRLEAVPWAERTEDEQERYEGGR
jgi:DnaK suppressor protein